MFDRIKVFSEKRPLIVSLFLFTIIATIHIPTSIDNLLVLISLPLLIVYRNKIFVDEKYKTIAYCLFLYLFIFTILSVDISHSASSLFNIARGFLFLALVQIFLYFYKKSNNSVLHSYIVFAAVNINYFFVQPHIVANASYFGYHIHPNKQAFSLCFFIVLSSFLLVHAKSIYARYVNIATILSALVLLYFSNSRSVWLGLVSGLFVILLFNKKISMKKKLFFAIAPLMIGFLFVVVLNKKPQTLSDRDILWQTLIEQTNQNHPLLGYGLNTSRTVLEDFPNLAFTAHNSLVEVYVSSGIIGAILFVLLFLAFFVKYFGNIYSNEFNVGAFGFVIFTTISLFDMTVFHYTFMATIFTFLGMSVYRETKTEHQSAL